MPKHNKMFASLVLSLGMMCVSNTITASPNVAFLLPARRVAFGLSRFPLFTSTDNRAGRTFHKARTSPLSAHQGNGGLEESEEMRTFNKKTYAELREHFAVTQEAPSVGCKRGGIEVFCYVPPSLREREERQALMPSPALTAQDIISTILSAMKANRNFGCRIYLRFLSDQNQHSCLSSAEDLKMALEVSGNLKVLLGNFRSFSFPTPTFEISLDGERPVAYQTVQIIVPGFMALMMGADNGYNAELKVMVRWKFSRDHVSEAWLADSVEILDSCHPQ